VNDSNRLVSPINPLLKLDSNPDLLAPLSALFSSFGDFNDRLFVFNRIMS